MMSLAQLSSLVKLTTAPLRNPGIWQSNQKACFSNKPKYTLVTRNVEDHKRRLLADKYELRRKLYKSVCKDPELPNEMRAKYRCKLSKLPRNSSFTRVRNRCVFTGRPRSVYQLFGMSRIVFRTLANKGEIPGVTKASW